MFVLFPNGEAPSAPAEPKAHVPHKAFRHRGRGTATLHDPGKSLEEAFGIVGLGGSGQGHEDAEPFRGFVEFVWVHVADDGGVDAGVDHHDVDDGLTESLSFKLQIEDGENGRRVADERPEDD